jgi:hypothetical protein
MIFKFLTLLTSLILLAACSQSNDKKELKVTGLLALENSSFSGGIIIRAKSSGRKFDLNLLDTDSASVTLENGTWNFMVVSWDGATPLAGTTRCALTTKNIDSSTKSISINVDNLQCSNFNFGERFRPIKIYNCSALLDSAGAAITSQTTVALMDSNFCDDNLALPISQRSTSQYVQFKIPASENGMISQDIIGPCIATGSDPVVTHSIPLKNIPLVIKLSDDPSCTSGFTYNFPNGITGSGGAISVLNLLDSNTNNLFLPCTNIKSPATISSFTVSTTENTILPSNSVLNVDDVIKIKVIGIDPNGLPLQYKFFKFGGTMATLSDWSTMNEINYTIQASDLGISGLSIRVAVKNTDGVNYNSTSFGDATQTWNFSVPGNFSPAVINSFLAHNSVNNNQIPNNSSLVLGDSVQLTINSTDPNNLPLEYKFFRFGSDSQTLQDWSPNNQYTYIVNSNDEGINKVTIRAAVRNNDGANFNSTSFGDDTETWNFSAPGAYLPATITDFKVYDYNSNIEISSNTTLSVGQVLKIKVTASDPNNLSIEHKFFKFGSTTVTLQEWSSSNEVLYTVSAEDAGIANITIRVAVRNDDSKSYNSTSFGDATSTWNFTAY